MVLLALGGIIIVAAAGVAAVIYSARHAVTGYEDDCGFHEGNQGNPETQVERVIVRTTVRRIPQPAAEKSQVHDPFEHGSIEPVGH